MKELLRELGRAINGAVSESERIADAIAHIKENGYDVFLMLDAIVGLNKNSRSEEAGERSLLNHQDRRFLKSLKIRLDDEQAAAERNGNGRLTITPQDVKFLKSLRINVDDLR
jgi:hypothetical protein